MKRHYGQIAQPIAKLSIARPPRILMDPDGWAAEQRQSLAKQAGPTFARARTAESDRTARKAAEAQAAKEQGRADRLQAAMDEQKALSARLRALPLPMCWTPSVSFRTRPKRPAGRPMASTSPLARGQGVEVVRPRRRHWQRRQHRPCAACHRIRLQGALAWLADRFGPGAAAADLTARLRAQAVAEVKAAVAEREPFTPPQPAPEHWQHVEAPDQGPRLAPRLHRPPA